MTEKERARSTRKKKRRYQKRKDAGLCVRCPLPAQPARPGETCCEACFQKANAKQRERHHNNRKLYNQRSHDWRQANPEKYKECDRKCHDDKKMQCISHYSNGTFTCQLCPEKRLEALNIDHINQDGAKHRREVCDSHMRLWLIKNQFPEGFRVLCANCNWRAYLNSLVLVDTQGAKDARKHRAKLKKAIMDKFGGKCTICSTEDIDVLTVHHTNHDGGKHRSKISRGERGGSDFYKAVMRIGDYSNLECRCRSCNCAEEIVEQKYPDDCI